MERILRAIFAVVAALTPAAALAQTSPQGDVAVSVGADRIFRVEDRTFGTVTSPGVSVEWRVAPRVGVGVDLHRAVGLSPEPVRCTPPAGVSCTGSGRDGVFSATVTSATAAWYFEPTARLQPYVVGGMAAVRARTVSSLTVAKPEGWTVSEREERDTGFGITGGIGLRLLVSDRVVIKPEWRLSSGLMLSRANLSVMRTSVAVGYGW